MSRIGGVVVGTVKDVADPDGFGRIKVELPWLEGDSTQHWAPVATLASGGERGSWWMPETGDEVLVAFDHGDVSHPFVIGYTWNGAAKPPADGGASVRRVKTVAGHVLEFDDRSGEEKILVKTRGEQQIELVDSPAKITVKTKNGQTACLEDSPAKVTVKTSGNQSVVLDESAQAVTIHPGNNPANEISIKEGQGITLNHLSGSVSVMCQRAEVTASSQVSITAPTVSVSCTSLSVTAASASFTGVVQAAAFQSGAITSGAYTPGAGNTIGL